MEEVAYDDPPLPRQVAQQQYMQSYRPEPTMKELSAQQFNNQSWCIHPGPEKDSELSTIRQGAIEYMERFNALNKVVIICVFR